MFCAISGTTPEEPVVSRPSGLLFERRLIEKHIAEYGTCPVTKESLSNEDLIPVKINKAVKPRPLQAASIPGMLSLFQNVKEMKGKERLFPKLGMRYYGPFQVCDNIRDVAYRLKLPKGWKIHYAFRVSLLRPFVGDVPDYMFSEEQAEVEELDEILVPKQILAHKDRIVRGKVARRYLVKFKNYSPMDAKWMEEAELVDSPLLLQLYLETF
ncbi:hypothetical protein L7F22_009805 [Adiantum nelumboides]|nr:hypothetical protein [Adiantum nelumboides]